MSPRQIKLLLLFVLLPSLFLAFQNCGGGGGGGGGGSGGTESNGGSATFKIPPYVTQWGSQGSYRIAGTFQSPVALLWANGLLHSSDGFGNQWVQKFDADGTFNGYFGYTTGVGSNGTFSGPEGMGVDASGNIYVVDSPQHRVQVFNASGVFQRKWGTHGTGNGQFTFPYGVAVSPDNTKVYVTDDDNNRVEYFDLSGNYLGQFNGGGLQYPKGIVIDSAGNVYVASQTHEILKYSATGTFLQSIGGQTAAKGDIFSPEGLAIGPDNNLYVASSGRNSISVFKLSGEFLGKWGSYGSGNGQFSSPTGVALDPHGNVYVMDSQNFRIQKFGAATSGGGGTSPPPTDPLTLVSISVAPVNSNVNSGATKQFAATAHFYNGTTSNVTATSTWTSSATAKATINSAGLATGVASGTTTITATYQGKSDSTTLSVNVNFTITGFEPSANAPGGILFVNGTNFVPGYTDGTNTVRNTTVTVCGTPATLNDVTTTKITVVIPPSIIAPNLCDVAVTTSSGTAIGADKFSVLSAATHVPSIYFTELGTVNVPADGKVYLAPKTGGAKYILATKVYNPRQIVTDGTNLFFSVSPDGVNGSIYTVGVNGGNTYSVASPIAQGPRGIAVDATNIYWTQESVGQTLLRTDKGGSGNITTIVNSYYGAAKAIAIDANSIFWTTSSPHNVYKIPIASPANTNPTPAVASATSGTYIPNLESITVDADNIYYTDQRNNGEDGGLAGLKKVAKTGGAVTTLATGLTARTKILNDDVNIYMVDTTSIRKVNLATSAVTTLISGIYNYHSEMAQDEFYIYFIDGESIKRISKSGGSVTTLVTSLNGVSSLAVDP